MTTFAGLPTAADVTTAAKTIRPHARRTPIMRVSRHGRPMLLKLEHLQLSGSFKLRGAVNALSRGERPARVVTASGGNHGLAVATAARLLDVPATVYVPESAPESKTRRIEAAGAKLVRHGATYAEAAKAAMGAVTGQERYLPAYDHPDVIAGQGTMGAEIVADVPEVDAVFVAVGGGGLAAGTALSIGDRTTVAVEPEGCNALQAALAAGRPVDTEVRNSVASSALGATRVGDLPFAILNSPRTRSVLVSDPEIIAAQELLWEEYRLAVEPAAAAPLAAWLADRVPAQLPCIVLCGANSAWTTAP
ncbi:serine/threonine dehydratase [Kutzneria sp. CA-103260]|uniref:serine/threonine dehydratase n=1 Tax=Kutzneria sp. CA-103260 TaxID=2802641 RepID=UPI001BA49C3D|nr:serine/threonine dehydratase [Kutzneria sp. CA-103260]QUQ71361.1 threonine dehydratase [Kutzneria sp. CA-103260]